MSRLHYHINVGSRRLSRNGKSSARDLDLAAESEESDSDSGADSAADFDLASRGNSLKFLTRQIRKAHGNLPHTPIFLLFLRFFRFWETIIERERGTEVERESEENFSNFAQLENVAVGVEREMATENRNKIIISGSEPRKSSKKMMIFPHVFPSLFFPHRSNGKVEKPFIPQCLLSPLPIELFRTANRWGSGTKPNTILRRVNLIFYLKFNLRTKTKVRSEWGKIRAEVRVRGERIRKISKSSI